MFKRYDAEFAKDKKLDINRFIYGYVGYLGATDRVVDGQMIHIRDEPELSSEQSNPYVISLYAKSLGDSSLVDTAPYLDFYSHQDPAYAVPAYLINTFKSDPAVYGDALMGPGSSISLWCAKDRLQKDFSTSDVTGFVRILLPTGQSARIWEEK